MKEKNTYKSIAWVLGRDELFDVVNANNSKEQKELTKKILERASKETIDEFFARMLKVK